MKTVTILLRTKLHKPHIIRNHLHRHHLVDRLNRYLQRPLTLVSAPAGYGKSSLLACWLETSDIQSAWVSLDKNDNDQRLFLAYLLEAIHSLFPGMVKETQALLGSPRFPPTTILSRSLINELDIIGQPFVLVLDDYYTIQAKERSRLDHGTASPRSGVIASGDLHQGRSAASSCAFTRTKSAGRTSRCGSAIFNGRDR